MPPREGETDRHGQREGLVQRSDAEGGPDQRGPGETGAQRAGLPASQRALGRGPGQTAQPSFRPFGCDRQSHTFDYVGQPIRAEGPGDPRGRAENG